MLMDDLKKIHQKKKSDYPAGSVYRVFEIYLDSAKDESGYYPEFKELTVEEKKKKKSIN